MPRRRRNPVIKLLANTLVVAATLSFSVAGFFKVFALLPAPPQAPR
jgi:hypothetical protein